MSNFLIYKWCLNSDMVMDYRTAFIIIVYLIHGCYFGIFMPVLPVVVVIVFLYCIICFVKKTLKVQERP
jgi:TRAP-type C4-dicarboxylate transport system permease large subunit